MATFSWMNNPWDRDQTPVSQGWDTGVWSLPGYSFLRCLAIAFSFAAWLLSACNFL